MSLIFFTIFALILLCPVAVNADEDKKSEFGTVIGIGKKTRKTVCNVTCGVAYVAFLDLGTTYSCVG